jgi:hypothetical protein
MAAAFWYLERVVEIRRAPGAHGLRHAFLPALAVQSAVSSRMAITIGAAAEAICVLRKLAAGFVANFFYLIERAVGQGRFSGQQWTAEAKNADHD